MSILKAVSQYYHTIIQHHEEPEVRSSEYATFEVAGILMTAIMKFIMMDWLKMVAFYTSGVSLYWIGYIIYRQHGDRTTLRRWGFTRVHFNQAMLFLIPFILLTLIAGVLTGLSNDVEILNWRVIPVLFMYPLWGLFQQFIMIILICGNLTELERFNLKRWQVVLITSLLFSMVHYPSFFLMGFTFGMEIIILTAWFRWRNLLAIGVTHGIVGTILLFYMMGRDPWIELFAFF